MTCLPSWETRKALSEEAVGKLVRISTAPVLMLRNLIVFPLMKSRSSSSKNWRSLLAPPSLVITLASVPSILASQISLFATNAILSAFPIESATGAGTVSVAAGGASVAVSAGRITASVVISTVGSDVLVAGTDVDVLTGASVVAGGRLTPLNKKNPPAIAARATTGITMVSILNPFFSV